MVRRSLRPRESFHKGVSATLSPHAIAEDTPTAALAAVLRCVPYCSRSADLCPKPRINVVLTNEAFFRIIESGEALFCNAILLAQGGPVLVTKVRAILTKT